MKQSPKPPANPSGQPLQIRATHITQQFSGPLPRPEILEHYNRISPGAADRIIAMAEDNNRHFQAMDTLTMTAAFRERRRGQFFGLIVGRAGFITCVAGFWLGYPEPAAWLGGTTIVSLVGIFITGRLLRPAKQ